MFIIEFLIVLVLALIFTAMFALLRNRYGPLPDLLWMFVILLFATWALGVWFRPIGPPVGGVYWASFLAAIVVVSLLLMVALSGPRPPEQRKREELKGVEIRPRMPTEKQLEEERTEAAAIASLGFLSWVFLAVALAALITHYVIS